MALSENAALRKDRNSARGYARLEHRHFAVIADIISQIPAEKRLEIAKHFADRLASSNHNFDRERFLRASSVIAS